MGLGDLKASLSNSTEKLIYKTPSSTKYLITFLSWARAAEQILDELILQILVTAFSNPNNYDIFCKLYVTFENFIHEKSSFLTCEGIDPKLFYVHMCYTIA